MDLHYENMPIEIQLTPLSRLHLSRITAYLEVKSGPALNMKIYQQKVTYCRKEEKLFFHNIFNISLNSGVKLHIHL